MFSRKKIVQLICKTSMQPLMHKLHVFALAGMNYGNANILDHNLTGEKRAIEYIGKKTKPEQELILFDVGANAGNYCILLSQVLQNPQKKLFAFEPSKFSFPLLVENTAALNEIKCFNFGLGKQDENVTLYANYEGSGATTLYRSGFENYSVNKNLEETIHLETLDEFCGNNAIDKIDFLKIDVEGHELFVLQGGLNMLGSKKIRFIQFEFGPFHVYSKTFFKDFWDLLSPGYVIFRIVSDGLYEIKIYSENLEIFRTSNFLAELRQ